MPQRQSSSGAEWSFGFFRHGAQNERCPPVQEATSATAGSHTTPAKRLCNVTRPSRTETRHTRQASTGAT